MVQLAVLLTRSAPEPLALLAAASLDGVTIVVLALLAAFLLMIVWANRPAVMRRYSDRKPEEVASAPREKPAQDGAGGAPRTDGSTRGRRGKS